ncbi:MAG: hypothetical protein ACR2LK_07920 [Solirubrobacteraceae bacterium]
MTATWTRPETTAGPRPARPRTARQLPAALAIKARLRNGELFTERLPATGHRRIHLALLHCATDGYVELAAGPRPPGGKVRFITRKDPVHFLPGGATATAGWLEALLELAVRHDRLGDELAVAPAVRDARGAAKRHVTHTNWLWIDVDGADQLPEVKRFLRRKPAHLVVESAGSGGVHCYWRLREPLHAHPETTCPDGARGSGPATAGMTGDMIERAHERLIYALGYTWSNGTPIPTIADRACKDRSRVMRLAGTLNGKSGNHARVMWADLALPGWRLRDLIGDLPDPPTATTARRCAGATVSHDDPYKRIAPVEYFQRLAGIEVPQHGLVSCPNPLHDDATPSCHVGSDASEGWCCHGCGSAGAIYDLASVVLGGPTGRWLRGEEFRRARDHVRRTLGAA